MHHHGIQRADTDEAMAFHSPTRIQKKRDEAFALGIKIRVRKQVGIPVLNDLLWCVTNLQVLRQRAFAQGYDFEFLWIEGVHNAPVQLASTFSTKRMYWPS